MLLDWFVRHKRFGRFKRVFNRDVLPLRPLGTFPRRIHLYWDQGFESAPQIVRMCVESWKRHHPGWEIRLWDRNSAETIVSFAEFADGLKVTPYSDILRTELLRQEGGVWADATIYCMRPLDSWLLQIMAQTDFFAFDRPGPDRQIASWFLAARPGALIVSALAAGMRQFWARQSVPTRVYHWWQYIFEYRARTSRSFRREWQTAPRLSAGPLLMLQLQLLAGGEPSDGDLELYRALPMHKLTHKKPLDSELITSLLG